MALLAFVLLFLGFVAVVLLVGRMVKREVRKPLPAVRDLTDAWAEKPLNAENRPAKTAKPSSGKPSAE
jgi:hypothetical protein